ncbi:MAG: hypothetical protein DRH11_17290 [Deltaproteobacteria bacterium]|nr:MAG: hypothetical protein DRH11_17290 [Deltaproteobacteria bacterium]
MCEEKRRGGKEKEKGFTLLELIIAISILTVGLLAVGSMQTGAIVANSRAYQITESTNAAQVQLEELIRKPWGSTDLSVGAHSPVSVGRYSVSWNVSTVAGLPNTLLITVTAQWTEKGVARSTVLTVARTNLM